MRILFYTCDYKPMLGGIGEYLYNLALEMSKRHDVFVLAPDLPGSREFDEKQPFTTYRYAHTRLKDNLTSAFDLRRIIKKERIDVVFAGMYYPTGLLTYLVTRFRPVPYVVQTYAVEILETKGSIAQRVKRRMRWLRLRIFRNAAVTLTISHYTKQKLIDMGVAEKDIALFFCGIRLSETKHGTKAEKTSVARMVGKNECILTVARIMDYKGQDMVIKAMPFILKKHPDAKYLLVGKGPYEPALHDLVAKMQLERSVIFCGPVSEGMKEELYARCDVFVMASRAYEDRPDVEGFGITFLEAHAHEKPVVAGNSGGIPDAVLDKKTGLLADPWDSKDIAAKINKLLDDRKLAERLAKNGKERLMTELNWERIVPGIEKEIARRCKKRGGR